MRPGDLNDLWTPADTGNMTNAQRALKQLIGDELYVVDEQAVARAIVARCTVHATVAHARFRSEVQAPQVRSFRRDPGARSFRLQRSAALRHHS
jgi:hypothetical protein